MLYTVKSDTKENHGKGMTDAAYQYQVNATSAVDAIIRASKNAEDDEEVIWAEGDGYLSYAYRDEYGVYDFHIYLDSDSNDIAFTI